MSATDFTITIAELADRLGATVEGEGATLLDGVASLTAARPGQVSFLDDPKRVDQLSTTQASAVLLAPGFAGEAPCTALRIDRPRVAFIDVVRLFHPERSMTEGVHPTAVLASSAELGSGVHVGPYVVVGEGARVGAGTVLHAHVVLYDDVTLGQGCVVHSHAVLREGTTVGDHALIQPGAVLGADGFGYAPTEQGTHRRVPQVGDVELGDYVDIGANACVDRAALHTTRIGHGTKIDNLAQVGHNCIVGDHCLICGQVGMAGSSKLEDHVVLGGQVGLAGHLTIGKGARVAGGSGVVSDLESGREYGDAPARPMREAVAGYIAYTRLPQLMKQVKRLQKQVDDLTEASTPEESR